MAGRKLVAVTNQKGATCQTDLTRGTENAATSYFFNPALTRFFSIVQISSLPKASNPTVPNSQPLLPNLEEEKSPMPGRRHVSRKVTEFERPLAAL
jgi:hypothetical protein